MNIESFVYYIFYTFISDIFSSAELIFSDISTNTVLILSNEFYTFSYALGQYSVFSPAILVVIVGITGAGLYVVFVLVSGAQEVLP